MQLFNFLLTVALLCCNVAQGQFIIRGKITDATTNDPVPFANVGVKGSAFGATTDFEGNYLLSLKTAGDSLLVSYLGYKNKAKAIDKTQLSQVINIQLEPSLQQLAEVVIRAGENPAWAIMRKIVARKEQNDRKQLNAYEYESYNRVELSIDNLSEKMQQKKVIKKIKEAVDKMRKTAGEDGKPVLPVFVSETVSNYYFRDSPRKTKEVVLSSRVKGVGLADESILNELLGSTFQDFNFYQNWVRLVGKDVHSPIADGWRGTYDYYLADTAQVGLNTCYVIDFDPKNNLDLAFRGKMWIDTATFAIAQIDVNIGKEANINFIEKIKVTQEFEPVDSSSAWLPSSTRLLVDLSELSKNSAGLLAKIYTSNKKFVVNRPRSLDFYEQMFERQEDAVNADESFWQAKRPEPLSAEEQKIYSIIDTIKNVPIVRTYTAIARIALGGYIPISNSFEIGPYINLVAVNSIEGVRGQIGFRTRESFSKRWLLKGYLAGGTTDNRLKYGLDASYTILRQPWVQVGVRSNYDVERLGVNALPLGVTSLSNQLFATFARFGTFRRGFLQHEQAINISHEIRRGLTHTLTYSQRSFEPLFGFRYRTQPMLGEQSPLSAVFDVREFRYEMRFAKGEILIRNNNRRPLRLRKARDWPIFTFRYVGGEGGTTAGRRFFYHRFNLQIDKTLRIGKLGRMNTEWQLGYSPSTMPYPLLFNHQGNPSPVFIQNAYNTMQFFEFTSDRFASLGVFHDFEGFITNRIPLLRRLKWRSHVFARALIGDTRPANELLIPRQTPEGLVILPIDHLNPSIPYVEAGYGFDNIFKFLRIDGIHRLTYRDVPNAQKFVIKASVAFKL